jgi:hypothetical protein
MTNDPAAPFASSGAKLPDDAAAPSPDDAAVAAAYREMQARRLLDEMAASRLLQALRRLDEFVATLPASDPLRQATDRVRAAEGLPPLPMPSTPQPGRP